MFPVNPGALLSKGASWLGREIGEAARTIRDRALGEARIGVAEATNRVAGGVVDAATDRAVSRVWSTPQMQLVTVGGVVLLILLLFLLFRRR